MSADDDEAAKLEAKKEEDATLASKTVGSPMVPQHPMYGGPYGMVPSQVMWGSGGSYIGPDTGGMAGWRNAHEGAARNYAGSPPEQLYHNVPIQSPMQARQRETKNEENDREREHDEEIEEKASITDNQEVRVATECHTDKDVELGEKPKKEKKAKKKRQQSKENQVLPEF